MKNYNVFWFIIDSVRTYRTNLDDRDRLDFMDEFAKESIEFKNCVTSAPSSLLSAGAMFTGLPATFVSRHFNDFKIKDNEISTISTLVKNFSFKSYPILDSRDLRIPLHHILSSLHSKDLPAPYKLSDYAWHNRDINIIFKYILGNHDKSLPGAFIVWNDCRRDSKTSEYVKEMIEYIKSNNFYDNSIIIMHSDHGYPDPSSKIDEKFFKNYTNGQHDHILTDDNIRVPLFIKYPGSPNNIKIDNCVGLIDVLPTIYDLLNIDYTIVNECFQGKSLLPTIRNEEKDLRYRFTDTRLPMDINRLTSIRTTNHKYIFIQDTKDEFLFDLENNPMETINYSSHINKQLLIKQFRDIKNSYERSIFFFHEEQLKRNAKLSFKTIKSTHNYKSKNLRAIIISKNIESLIFFLAESIKNELKCAEIDLIYEGNDKLLIKGISTYFKVDKFSYESIKRISFDTYDYALFLTENSSRVYLKNDILKGVKAIPSKKYILINYNFELFNYFVSKWLSSNKLKMFLDWDNKGIIYKEEPLFLIKDSFFFLKWAIIKVFKNYFTKSNDIDLKAAKDMMEFRSFHLDGNKSGLHKMEEDQFINEFDRIQTREK